MASPLFISCAALGVLIYRHVQAALAPVASAPELIQAIEDEPNPPGDGSAAVFARMHRVQIVPRPRTGSTGEPQSGDITVLVRVIAAGLVAGRPGDAARWENAAQLIADALSRTLITDNAGNTVELADARIEPGIEAFDDQGRQTGLVVVTGVAGKIAVAAD